MVSYSCPYCYPILVSPKRVLFQLTFLLGPVDQVGRRHYGAANSANSSEDERSPRDSRGDDASSVLLEHQTTQIFVNRAERALFFYSLCNFAYHFDPHGLIYVKQKKMPSTTHSSVNLPLFFHVLFKMTIMARIQPEIGFLCHLWPEKKFDTKKNQV